MMDHDGLTGHYTFTYEQLYDVVSEAICLAYEYIERHGHDQVKAQTAATTDTLEGLDAERDLWAAGEISKPSQILP